MFSKLLIVMTALVAVNAQSSASTISSASPAAPSLDACIIECSTNAATQNGCSSFADVACVCTSAQFQADAGACIQENCSAADLQTALALQQAECAAASLSPSGPSATPHPVSFTTPAGTGSVTATSPSMSASTPASSVVTIPTGTTGSTGSTPASSTTPPATSSAAAASSLVANGGVAAIVAMIAGFLAI